MLGSTRRRVQYEQQLDVCQSILKRLRFYDVEIVRDEFALKGTDLSGRTYPRCHFVVHVQKRLSFLEDHYLIIISVNDFHHWCFAPCHAICYYRRRLLLDTFLLWKEISISSNTPSRKQWNLIWSWGECLDLTLVWASWKNSDIFASNKSLLEWHGQCKTMHSINVRTRAHIHVRSDETDPEIISLTHTCSILIDLSCAKETLTIFLIRSIRSS